MAISTCDITRYNLYNERRIEKLMFISNKTYTDSSDDF